MQCQDSRGSFDCLYGNNIQVKPINYFAIKFPRHTNKHCLKTAYTVVQPTGVQRGFFFFACICFLPLCVQRHPPHQNISRPLPFRLERHRERTALQVLSQQAGNTQPRRALHRHAPAHRGRKIVVFSHSKLPPSRETEAQPREKNQTMVLCEPTSPASSHSAAVRARGTGMGAPSAAGGTGQPPNSIFRGAWERDPWRGARALEGFMPAWGCHMQLQACRGKIPLVLHLKTKSLEK